MEIRKILSNDEYELFLRQGEYAVILFDAPWDIGPGSVILPFFQRAASLFTGRVNFGEINTDCEEIGEVANSIPIASLPTVAYYQGGRLVAAIIGAPQDVTARIEAMMEGKRIGRGDGRDLDDEGRILNPERKESWLWWTRPLFSDWRRFWFWW